MEWSENQEYGNGYYIGYQLAGHSPDILDNAIQGFSKAPGDFLRGLKAGKAARVKEMRKQRKALESKESMEHLRHYMKENKKQKDYEAKERIRQGERDEMKKKMEEHKAKEQVKDELLNPAKRKVLESEWIKNREEEIKVQTRLQTLNELSGMQQPELALAQGSPTDSKEATTPEMESKTKAIENVPEEKNQVEQRMEQLESLSTSNDLEVQERDR